MKKSASRFLKRSGLSPSPLGIGVRRKQKTEHTVYLTQKRNQSKANLDKHFVDFLIMRGFQEKRILSLIKKLKSAEDSASFINKFIRRNFPELHIQINDQIVDHRYKFSTQFKKFMGEVPKNRFANQMRDLGYCPLCKIDCGNTKLDIHLAKEHPQIIGQTTLFK